MPAEGRENHLLKKGNSDAFFREKYLTKNKYFSEDDTLLCSLDRVFDDATVFMIKGDSYRGRKLETLGLEAGIAKHTEFKNA